MTAYSRKRRRRETIAFVAECAGALGLVLSFTTLFFAMLGLMTLRMVIWFPIGALLAATVAHFYKDERVAPKAGTADSPHPARTHRPR